jgi:hypothetical protein
LLLEVPPGAGQFAWIDYNNDNVQQLNEFELAAFPDQGKIHHILTPAIYLFEGELCHVKALVSIHERCLIRESEGFKKLISRLALSLLCRSIKNQWQRKFEFNPFKYGVDDTALITLNTVF